MSLSQTLKSLTPAALRSLLQPRLLRDYRNRRSFRARHVHIARPTEVIDSQLGDYVKIAQHCWVMNSTLGSHSYVADRATVAYCDIGKFCSIATNTYVGLAQHPSRTFVSTHPAFYLADPANLLMYCDKDYFHGWARTTIGHDVWIGSAAQVRSGVTIGNGAIIGAGAVVTGDVAPYAIMVGVPAKPLRYRFDDETIAFLERFRWWDRDEAWLARNFKKFHDVQAFRQEFEKQSVGP